MRREPIIEDKEAADSSVRPRRPPIERRSLSNTTPTPIPQEAMDVARGELREVMVQYTACGDPSESATRRERVRQAEVEGQFEEAAENMVRASMVSAPLAPHDEDETEIDLSQERIPVALRLGPLNAPAAPRKVKKRSTARKPSGRPPGRPPGKKKQNPSPLAGAAASSKRNKMH